MLNESASSLDDRPYVRSSVVRAPEQDDTRRHQIREIVETVLAINRETFQQSGEALTEDGALLLAQGSQWVATFEGRLITDSESAYETLDQLLASSNLFALFREVNGQHVIHILAGRVHPVARPWWPNLLLLIATLVSVLLVGTDIALNEIASVNLDEAHRIAQNGLTELWRGLPYALSLMLILGAHELGHYFAARRHRLAVTLPYFIPLPFLSPFGTLGAFIQLRQPMRNRKMLLDVGAAGPLAGLIFAVPILLIGLAHAPLQPISGLGGVYEGDSVIYALAKTVTFGRFVPDGRVDVCVNCSQLAWSGWTGLLVTALNLVPLGQLDGGHVLYSAIGDRARRLYYPLLACVIALTLFVSSAWWLWLLLLVLFGRVYAAPLDTITPLDKPRRIIALASLIVFALVFVPAPLTQTGGGGILNGATLMVAVPAIVLTIGQRLKRTSSGER